MYSVSKAAADRRHALAVKRRGGMPDNRQDHSYAEGCRMNSRKFQTSLLMILMAGLTAWVHVRRQPPAIRPVTLARPRVRTHRFRLPYNAGAAGLQQALRALDTRASALFIVAHPDDEDGGLLTWLSRHLGARVDLLTLNRGEGGQNVMSRDYWDRLGLVRTQELLAADRYYGVHRQYWSRVIDFGFSKTKAGSLQQWGRNRVLGDVVRVVRLTHPMIILSSFVGGPSDGHGNHQVAGEMAQLAYAEAGNASLFPRQIQAGLRPWAPLADYARQPFFRSRRGIYDYATGKIYPPRIYDYITRQWLALPMASNARAPEGAWDPWLGRTYLQIARQGWSLQKSQNGGGGVPGPGPLFSGYHRMAARVPVPPRADSFFAGMNTTLAGLAELAPPAAQARLTPRLASLQTAVTRARRDFSGSRPWRTAPALARGERIVSQLLAYVHHAHWPAGSGANLLFELRQKQEQFNHALILALGLHLGATVAPAKARSGPFAAFAGPQPGPRFIIPGATVEVQTRLYAQAPWPLGKPQVSLHTPRQPGWRVLPLPNTTDHPLQAGRPSIHQFSVQAPANARFTRPYFTRPNLEQAYYNLRHQRDRNRSFAPWPLYARARVRYHGVTIVLRQVVSSVHRVTGLGAVFQPLAVAPAISLWIAPKAGVVAERAASFMISVRLHSNAAQPAAGTLNWRLPPGWRAEPRIAHFRIPGPGDDQSLNFRIVPRQIQPKPYQLQAVAHYDGHTYRLGYRTVGYAGLQPYYYYRPAAYQVTGARLQVAPGIRAGYIPGTGDQVPRAIASLGVPVTRIGPQQIARGNLRQYSVIMLGIRAYAAQPALAIYNARLLRYVRRGGVLIVQYNTSEYNHNYGPYPYELTNSPLFTVVREHARVRILAPQNPLLRWPNRITEADFAGWFEERGHDFMHHWSRHYQALLETHDPGQKPRRGGLLYARYGKGVYIYCAYALYRQLPEGVPGAFRLLANLISLPKNPLRSTGLSNKSTGAGR